MPIYEYRCASCGFQKEYLQKMSDARLTVCPECGKATLGKMVTAAGFQLKGSGWYATDFKHGAQSKPKSDDQSAAKTDAAPSATAEDKSTAKAGDAPAVKAQDAPAAASDKPAAEAPAKKTEGAAKPAASRSSAKSALS